MSRSFQNRTFLEIAKPDGLISDRRFELTIQPLLLFPFTDCVKTSFRENGTRSPRRKERTDVLRTDANDRCGAAANKQSSPVEFLHSSAINHRRAFHPPQKQTQNGTKPGQKRYRPGQTRNDP